MNLIDDQLKSLDKKLSRISKIETDRAYASAANKLTALVKTQVSRKVAQEVKLPVRLVKKRIFISRANVRKDHATISFYSKPVNAVSTNFRKMRKGYKVAGQNYPQSFFAKGKAKKHLIWQREGKSQYPIEPVKVDINTATNRYALPVFKIRMERDFYRLLSHEFTARIKKYV